MKHFIVILLLMFSFGFLKSEPDDTTKLKLEIHKYSHRKDMINKMFNAFIYSKFDSLVIYCNGYVDFFIIQNEFNVEQKNLTEYGAISALNDIFRGVSFEKFKILSGKNTNNEDVLFVQIFFFDRLEENKTPDINVYFVLDSKEFIKSIILN